MNARLTFLAAIALACLCGCASTSLTSMRDFADPDFLHRRCVHVVVLVACPDLRIRANLEERMAAALREEGVLASCSVTLFPPTRSVDEHTIVSVLREKDIDSYLAVLPGAGGVEEVQFPVLGSTTSTTGDATVFGNSLHWNQQTTTKIIGGGTASLPWKFYRAMLVDSETARTMWIADSYTKGNRSADFSTLDDSYCREVVSRLRLQGFIAPLSLGVTVRAPKLFSIAKLTGLNGVEVTEVVSGGPAHKAGIVSGDVILAIGGEPVNNASAMVRVLMHMRAGIATHVKVLRGRNFIRIPVVLTDEML